MLLAHVERVPGLHPSPIPIKWTDDGKAFVVRDKQVLTSKILPVFFGEEAKYASFTRKLYRWGFRLVGRCPRGKKKERKEVTFRHEYFQRFKTNLIHK